MQASIQCAASTLIQLLPVKFALESNHNTLNQFTWLASVQFVSGNISRAQQGPHDSSSVAISRQELSQEHRNNRNTFRYTTPRRNGLEATMELLRWNLQSAARTLRQPRRGDLAPRIITRAEQPTGAGSRKLFPRT
jgi:hypothetical protein